MPPRALLAVAHQPRAFKVRKMSRDLRLRRVEYGHNIADAKLSLDEQMKDAQARFIREGLEHSVDGLIS
jgi:hypothetical protein